MPDVVAVVMRYVGMHGSVADGISDTDPVLAATSAYMRQGACSVTQSRYLWHSREAMTSVLIKPRQRLHWTLDRAFADGDLVTAAAMIGFSSREAA